MANNLVVIASAEDIGLGCVRNLAVLRRVSSRKGSVLIINIESGRSFIKNIVMLDLM